MIYYGNLLIFVRETTQCKSLKYTLIGEKMQFLLLMAEDLAKRQRNHEKTSMLLMAYPKKHDDDGRSAPVG